MAGIKQTEAVGSKAIKLKTRAISEKTVARVIKYSCMNIYAYSCLKLLSNRPDAVLKQQSPCLNHEIHVAFEHGIYLNIRIAFHILSTDVTV